MGLDDAQLTRRHVLLAGGAVLVGLGTASGLPGALARAATAATGLGTIDFMGYAENALQKTMGPWEKANGVKFNTNFTAFDGALIAKFMSGGASGIDLITYIAVNGGPIWGTDSILTPLDTSKIPNVKNLPAYFRSPTGGFWMTPGGQRYGVPVVYSTLGITYDSAVLEPKAWLDLLNPKYKGRIGIQNNFVANLDIACRILGYKPSQLTPDKVAKVKELLKRFLDQARSVSATTGDLVQQFLSGEVVASFAGEPFVSASVVRGGKKTVKTNILPKEGSASFAVVYALAKTADNPNAVHAFLNQVLDPKTNAAAAVESVAAPTVQGAWKYLPKSLQAIYPSNPHALFGNNPILASPPFDSTQYLTLPDWSQQWQQLVVGG